METRSRENQTPPFPNIPPAIESEYEEYIDPGITSTVQIAGHPIHPVIVTFPIGLLVSVLLTDAAYWLTSDPFWAKASFWLIIGGLLSGILAGLIGMFDFIRIKRVREHSAGWAHLYGNVLAIILTAINLGLRFDSMTEAIFPAGLLISTIVATLLGISGWFGGELTFRHKVAVIGPSSRE